MQEPTQMSREWLTIRGKKISASELIRELDCGRIEILYQTQSESADQQYLKMIAPIQYVLGQYMRGKDEIDKNLRDYFAKYGQTMPENRKMPDCIEALFHNIEKQLERDLTTILEHAEKHSAEKEEQRLAKDKQHEDKCRQVRTMLWNGYGFASPFDDVDIIPLISRLCLIHRRKMKDEEYTLEPDETVAYELWTSMLTRKIANQRLSYAQMKLLISHGYFNESDFSKLLEQYGDSRDYEWYDEDFMGRDLDDDTLFAIDEILDVVVPKFKYVLYLE